MKTKFDNIFGTVLCIWCFVWFRSRSSLNDILRIQESCLRHRLAFCILFVLLNACAGSARSQETTGSLVPGRQRLMIRSTRDGSLQPSYIIVPAAYNANSAPAPLMVALHTWNFSIDNQRFQEFEQNAERRNWIYLSPEFRGVDDHPEACGSEIAQQDILDAVAWTRSHLKIDDKRIYLWGWSGGGHMALLMASRAPDLWAAVSAWGRDHGYGRLLSRECP
jgi:poly(3-hydroxybutyrate) depolymerase